MKAPPLTWRILVKFLKLLVLLLRDDEESQQQTSTRQPETTLKTKLAHYIPLLLEMKDGTISALIFISFSNFSRNEMKLKHINKTWLARSKVAARRTLSFYRIRLHFLHRKMSRVQMSVGFSLVKYLNKSLSSHSLSLLDVRMHITVCKLLCKLTLIHSRQQRKSKCTLTICRWDERDENSVCAFTFQKFT